MSVAFFYGSLDMRKLKWWQAAFVMLVVQATPGDYRDWEYVREWAKGMSREGVNVQGYYCVTCIRKHGSSNSCVGARIRPLLSTSRNIFQVQ